VGDFDLDDPQIRAAIQMSMMDPDGQPEGAGVAADELDDRDI
jgi:hypothetical protein